MEKIYAIIDRETAINLTKYNKIEGLINSGQFGDGIYGFSDLESAKKDIICDSNKIFFVLELDILNNNNILKNENILFVQDINNVTPNKIYKSNCEENSWNKEIDSRISQINKDVNQFNESIFRRKFKLIKENKKSSKNLLLEKMIISDPSFKVNLNENSNKEFYLRLLNEQKMSSDFNIVSELSMKHEMLSGNMNRDIKFIKECVVLTKSNSVEKFNKFIFETIINEDVDDINIDDALENLSNVCILSFQIGNDKLGKDVGMFSLPAGWTCPFAQDCLKKVSRDVNPDTNKLDYERGKDTKHDCYAASEELRHPHVRMNRWQNFDLLNAAKSKEDKVDLILRSLDHFLKNRGRGLKHIRVHESGDFFNVNYMDAWFEVAKQRPDINFYAYTKSTPYLKKLIDKYNRLDNFSITLSSGGRADDELENLDVKQSKVYSSPEEIYKDGKILDLDDNLAKEKGGRDKDFALLLHGQQKGGTDNAKLKIRNETFQNYWKNRKYLNKIFKLPEDYHMSVNDANKIINKIEDLLNKGAIKEKVYKDLKKMLNYVIKYHKYNFDEKLVNILQDKYK